MKILCISSLFLIFPRKNKMWVLLNTFHQRCMTENTHSENLFSSFTFKFFSGFTLTKTFFKNHKT